MKCLRPLRLLLESVLPSAYRDAALGDLDEEYESYVLPERGRLRAAIWYASQVARSLPHALALRARAGRKRRSRGDTMISDFVRDLRFAVRLLAKRPLFTLTAMLSLGIGVGSTATVFSFVDALFLRAPSGIREPARLVALGRSEPDSSWDNLSYPNYLDYRDRNRVFSALAAYDQTPRAVSVGYEGIAERVYGPFVSANYFVVMGTEPALGRFFLPDPIDTPSAPTVVVSHAFWQRRFGADPSLPGKTILVNGKPATVVGIAPRGFRGTLLATDLWIPLTLRPWTFSTAEELLVHRDSVWLQMVGRLKPGVSLEEARSAMNFLAAQLERVYPVENERQGIALGAWSVIPERADRSVAGFMGLLALVSGLVLLISCMNVVGMELAHVAARRRELAIRLALGAGRTRLLRLALTESLLLFLVGGAFGLLLAAWAIPTLASFENVLPFPVLVAPRLDPRVAAFGLLLSLACALFSGLFPALQGLRGSTAAITSAFKDDPRAAGFRRLKLRSVLVSGQVAMALSLLIAAGLLLRALERAASVDPGFSPDGVELAQLDLQLASYAENEGSVFWNDLLERARALPGVESTALAIDLPLDFSGFGLGGVRVPGHEPPPDSETYSADWNVVTPDYFRVMRIRLVQGRAFRSTDAPGAPNVAVINETMARAFWPNGNALGQTFCDGPPSHASAYQVIGIASDGKYRSIVDQARFFVHVPLAQHYAPDMTLLVRRSHQASVLPAIRALVRDLNPNLPLVRAEALSGYVGIGLLPQRLLGGAATSLGVVGLLLGAIGVYGITAYSVARRTREIGIRMALGAERRSVVRLMVWEGLRVGVTGCAFGIAASLVLMQLLRSLLLGLSPTDPATFAGVPVLLGLVLLFASYVPARKASAVDPHAALRDE